MELECVLDFSSKISVDYSYIYLFVKFFEKKTNRALADSMLGQVIFLAVIDHHFELHEIKNIFKNNTSIEILSAAVAFEKYSEPE